VLNLAAGFDTRPYRMDLPEALDWVEADLGPMIDEKEKLLAGEKPRCQLRRERIDLADPTARSAFLERATSGAKKALVLTEGLLGYLDNDVVRAMGRDFLSQPAVRWWVLDVTSPAILRMLQKGMGAHLDNAPLKFARPTAWPSSRSSAGRPVTSARSSPRQCARAARRSSFASSPSSTPSPIPASSATLDGRAWCGSSGRS
jgi:O-methyltransferase involved in polyketide biosynthesis